MFIQSLCLGLAVILFSLGCRTHVPVHVGHRPPPPVAQQPPKLPQSGHFMTDGLNDYAAMDGLKKSPLELRLIRVLNLTIEQPAALHCLAREYAARFAADQISPPPHASWAMAHHCGYWNVPRRPIMVSAENIDAIEAHLRSLPDSLLQGEIGIGAVSGPGTKTTVAVLIPKGDIRLKTVSRSGPLTLEGQIALGDGQLECWLQDRINGPINVHPIELSETGTFTFTAPSPVGGHRVELSRKMGQFRETVALINRGRKADTYAVFSQVPPSETSQMTPKTIVDGINRYRSNKGLPNILHEAHLTGPLNAWLKALSEGKRQELPPGILDSGGSRYADLEYALMNGISVSAVVANLEDTPTGFKLLNGEGHSGLGIGLLPFKDGRGADVALFMVKNFKAVSVEAGRKILVRTINEQRVKKGLKPLSLLVPLSDRIQISAQSIMAGHTEWANGIRSLLTTVTKERLVSGAFSGGGIVVKDLDQFDLSKEQQALFDPSAHFLGLGIASGPLPTNGAQRHIVIFVVAEGQPNG